MRHDLPLGAVDAEHRAGHQVAAAGHDRCIVPIKPENVDAWLNPANASADRLLAILEDRERPYYEHRMAA